MRLKKKAIMFFFFVAIAIITGSLAIYFYIFAPKTLTSAETAAKLESLYSRASGILELMSVDMMNLINGTITATTFSNRMDAKRNDMLVLRTELSELKNVAYPTYALSINLLDLGLQSYIEALGYAHDLNFNLTAQAIQEGTEYILQSKNALPQV
ncbi:hypothetical protein KEJ18_05375 [Candidatus Bathyarchaeota archaeon]|nr:hypothetical protein [Candidatus Bathyarchaeota archaeon]